MLAAGHQFDFLLQNIFCFFGESLAESVDLIFAEGKPDFSDRIDCGKFAERMNQNRRARRHRFEQRHADTGLLGKRVLQR